MSSLKKVRDDDFLMTDHFKDLTRYLQSCLDECETKTDKAIRVVMAVVLESLGDGDVVLDRRESRTMFRVVRNEEEPSLVDRDAVRGGSEEEAAIEFLPVEKF